MAIKQLKETQGEVAHIEEQKQADEKELSVLFEQIKIETIIRSFFITREGHL